MSCQVRCCCTLKHCRAPFSTHWHKLLHVTLFSGCFYICSLHFFASAVFKTWIFVWFLSLLAGWSSQARDPTCPLPFCFHPLAEPPQNFSPPRSPRSLGVTCFICPTQTVSVHLRLHTSPLRLFLGTAWTPVWSYHTLSTKLPSISQTRAFKKGKIHRRGHL